MSNIIDIYDKFSYKIGTTTKSGSCLNDPQAPLAFSTNIADPRPPRVAGRMIFITMKPWMGTIDPKELDKMKLEVADLIRYIRQAKYN